MRTSGGGVDATSLRRTVAMRVPSTSQFSRRLPEMGRRCFMLLGGHPHCNAGCSEMGSPQAPLYSTCCIQEPPRRFQVRDVKRATIPNTALRDEAHHTIRFASSSPTDPAPPPPDATPCHDTRQPRSTRRTSPRTVKCPLTPSALRSTSANLTSLNWIGTGVLDMFGWPRAPNQSRAFNLAHGQSPLGYDEEQWRGRTSREERWSTLAMEVSFHKRREGEGRMLAVGNVYWRLVSMPECRSTRRRTGEEDASVRQGYPLGLISNPTGGAPHVRWAHQNHCSEANAPGKWSARRWTRQRRVSHSANRPVLTV